MIEGEGETPLPFFRGGLFSRFSADRRFDLEHPAPGVPQVLRELEVGEDLLDLLAADKGPDVVPLGVTEQMRDDPGPLLDRAVAQEVARLLGRDLLVREEIKGVGAVETVTGSARAVHDAKYSPSGAGSGTSPAPRRRTPEGPSAGH